MRNAPAPLLLALILLFPGPLQAGGQPLRVEGSRDAMGGTFTVVAYGDNQVRLNGAVGAALEEAVRLDQLLSHYRPTSEWSEMNRDAGQKAVPLSDELFNLIQACLGYSRASEGAFDITVGPLLRVWGFYKGSGKLPYPAQIEEARGRVGYQHIELDATRKTIRFKRAGLELDPSGIGKGYAIDRMAAILREEGVASAFMTAAGSSIYGLGHPPSEARGWRTEIRNPRSSAKPAAVLYLRNQSLSTSGSQEKFFEAGGRIYSHIFDPRTGYPAQGRLQVSIVAPLSLDSEAWTKPIFIQGRLWASTHLPKGLRAFICEDNQDQPCLWLP